MLQPAKAGHGHRLRGHHGGRRGERTFLTSRGAEATLTAADLAGAPGRAGDAVYLSGYGLVHPSNRAALLGWLARLGAATWCSSIPARWSGPSRPTRWTAVLRRADWLTCNAREAALLTGSPDPRMRCGALARRPARPPGPGCWCAPGRTAACSAAAGRRSWRVPGFRGAATSTPTARATRTPERSSPRWRRARPTRRRPPRQCGGRALGDQARACHRPDPGGTGPVPRHRLTQPPARLA